MDDGYVAGRVVLKAARFLEGALLFTFCCHAAAMVSMTLIVRGLPGANATTVAQRAAYVGGHPWIWRLGWWPWQVTAFSDLFLCVALLCTPWMGKLPAALGLIATAIAIVPDQGGQFLWTWAGPAIARRAAMAGNFGEYARFESHVFTLIAGWGALGYIVGALCWTWCFAGAGIWSKRLTYVSIGAWGVFAVSTVALLLVKEIVGGSGALILVSAGNAVAFVLLMVWLMLVTEAVLARCRPASDHGLYAPCRFPSRGVVGWLFNLLASSHFARALAHLLPVLAMDSDIRDVVYVNYLVEADRLERFVAEPLKLQRLGPGLRHAMFTFLTFRHGHFGPRCFGWFRKLWPSPIQSNWRIYVEDGATGKRGIQFLTIGISAMRYALAARLMAENVPMHVTQQAVLTRGEDGAIHLTMDPGIGSAADVVADFERVPEAGMPHPWEECFGTWREMLAYCVPQDRAMSAQPWLGQVSRQEIKLDIPLECCRAMRGSVKSKAAEAIVGNAEAVCFMVDKVAFRLVKEEFDY
jgi:hypothetical protein